MTEPKQVIATALESWNREIPDEWAAQAEEILEALARAGYVIISTTR